ncbi:MAG: hypothetical protein ABL866_15305 [Devosia sp.]
MNDLAERLHREIGNMLRDEKVRESVRALAGYPREDFVQQEMRRRKIDARVVHIKALPAGMGGDFEIAWQPKAGGGEERQTFSLE